MSVITNLKIYIFYVSWILIVDVLVVDFEKTAGSSTCLKKKPKMQIKKRRKNMDAANKRRIKLKPSLKFSYPPIAGPVALKLTFSIINIEINNGNLISSHLYFFFH